MTAEPTPQTIASARLIAEFNTYAGLVDALRARAQERRISVGSEDFAAVSGLPARYASKILGSGKTKRLGTVSLGPILNAWEPSSRFSRTRKPSRRWCPACRVWASGRCAAGLTHAP
jgi:hypothetical protein